MHLDRLLLSAMATTLQSTSTTTKNGIHWFRRGLRLKDNPALIAAIEQNPKSLYPVYCLDGDSYNLRHCNALRANFLVECLQDLDHRLRERGSRLFVVSGDPVKKLPQLWEDWNIDFMTYDQDETGELYATQRDENIGKLAKKGNTNVELIAIASETLHPLHAYVSTSGKKALPISMRGFETLLQRTGPIAQPFEEPTCLPCPDSSIADNLYQVPKKATDLPWPRNTPRNQVTPIWGAEDCKNLTPIVQGGETHALQQLKSNLILKPKYVATYSKPQTSPTALTPSTTGLSPYLSSGCVSPRTVWWAIQEAVKKSNVKNPTKPPVSLEGQLLWRDFNYLMAHSAGENWRQMEGNKYCRHVPWDDDRVLLNAWKNGQTGYPWIDACMMQLKTEGWIHHLGRHAVACFLTRGDLWQSWEQGALHFESHLLDADYALNTFNWLWLSCSGFFYQYFRCYSPVAFQKKKDPSGMYIRKYLPVLAKLPDKYIYEPWKAPIADQKAAGIRIGVDYPKPIVEHTQISKENMSKMAAAYEAVKKAAGVDGPPKKKKQKTQKQSKIKF